jgi:hypothetical protein
MLKPKLHPEFKRILNAESFRQKYRSPEKRKVFDKHMLSLSSSKDNLSSSNNQR